MKGTITASANKMLGVVKALQGEVFVRAADGEIRRLSMGDH